MIDIALNRIDEDLQFDSNSNGTAALKLISDADYILQKIKISLKTWLTHWFLDQRRGVPYLEVIFVKQTRDSTRESILRAQIMAVPGVRQILDFVIETDPRTRLATIRFVCDTTAGRISGSVDLDKIR